MTNKEENVFSKIVIVVAIIIAIVATYFFIVSEVSDKPLRGSLDAGKADIGGDFVLIDQDSNVFSSDQLKGKPSLIYFGFTFCPDICPTALEKISLVIDELKEHYVEVTPVFITIDPMRDTSLVLKKYLGHFHPSFIGLTADKEEDTKKVADLFKVFYEVVPNSGTGKNDHLFDHSSLLYIMDKNGHYVGHLHISSSSEEMVDYIRTSLK